MSEGNDKTKKQEDAHGTVRPNPALQSGVDLPGQTQIGDLSADTPLPLRSDDYTPLTITSVASLSAELFSPDQAPMIKAYQDSLKQTDKGDVFALAGGTVRAQDVGIQTELEQDVIEKYAEFEYSERQTKGSRMHDYGKIGIGAGIAFLIWAIKEIWFSG